MQGDFWFTHCAQPQLLNTAKNFALTAAEVQVQSILAENVNFTLKTFNLQHNKSVFTKIQAKKLISIFY